ncbi:plasmid pRiA4b ORF-3 family protein [Rhodococcus aetherivorans]|uniref:plasmid pRiA4b ORF-3 family protein n=1 Tax=Rhodococcus aetherivorans TaxID=191292 RepID=UPI0036BCD011
MWRRLELPGDLALDRVHVVIQAAMGWFDSHLHRFRTGNDPRSPHFVTVFDVDEGEDGVLESTGRLDQLLAGTGDRLWYEYAFGDGWDYVLAVEAVLAEPPPRHPHRGCLTPHTPPRPSPAPLRSAGENICVDTGGKVASFSDQWCVCSATQAATWAREVKPSLARMCST